MKKNWNLKSYVYNADLSVEEMTNAIRVFEVLQVKYPNDEFVDNAIDILRNEICMMYGGSIYGDDI
jgi:hypothetical protein